MNKLLLLSALLIFACSSDSEGNDCIYEPTLSTEAVTDITETSATLNGVISIVLENCEVALGGMQGFVYSTNPSPTNDDNVEVVYGTEISTTIDNLIPNTTYYVRVFITNSLGEFYGNEIDFTTEDNGGEPADCDVVYLDENGVTIKACESANIGDVGTINGVEYTVVDKDMLQEMMLDPYSDISKACVSKITDMSELFFNALSTIGFSPTENNHIDLFRSWDVSNVTNMSYMFYNLSQRHFNSSHNFSYWNVSNVTDMSYMFYNTKFSDVWADFTINNWDVSNVTNMQGMFKDTDGGINFNLNNWDVSNVNDMSFMFENSIVQFFDISDWDVSNVTNMEQMFRGMPDTANSNNNFIEINLSDWNVSNVTNMIEMFCNCSFREFSGIGNWNVSNVTNMTGMFANSEFNEPIGNWDVSNVTNMSSMFCYGNNTVQQNYSDISSFEYEQFNQPIVDWDVSNVINMSYMFLNNHQFSQDISNWDVSSVTSMDWMFFLYWGNGTIDAFNSDLSNWNVNNVIECSNFEDGRDNWTLPQPNFTNCNPN